MKFAGLGEPSFCSTGGRRGVLTIRCCIQDYEACIDIGLNVIFLERDGICVSSQTVCRFEQMDFMVRIFESPYGSNTRAATANYGHLLGLLFAAHHVGKEINEENTRGQELEIPYTSSREAGRMSDWAIYVT